MKWLKKLLGLDTTPAAAPADAGAKAFDTMAKTLSAPEEKVTTVTASSAPEPKVETVTVVAEPAPEVQVVAEKVEQAVKQAKPKAPRKPRAKKEATTPLPQTVVANVDAWPYPAPAEGKQKAKPAAKTRTKKSK